jgi:hypothetical protein
LASIDATGREPIARGQTTAPVTHLPGRSTRPPSHFEPATTLFAVAAVVITPSDRGDIRVVRADSAPDTCHAAYEIWRFLMRSDDSISFVGAVLCGELWTVVDSCGVERPSFRAVRTAVDAHGRRLEIYGSEGWGLSLATGASSPGRADEAPMNTGVSSRGGNSALNAEVLWEPFAFDLPGTRQRPARSTGRRGLRRRR